MRTKAVYLAIGMRPSGHEEVLVLWIEQTEGAKFWLRVMNGIKARGTNDILVSVVDGLKGFPESITAAFLETVVQTCIVHPIRYSMQFAFWKECKAVAAALKLIYRAEDRNRSRPCGSADPARTRCSSQSVSRTRPGRRPAQIGSQPSRSESSKAE